jgi:hypothetical protein
LSTTRTTPAISPEALSRRRVRVPERTGAVLMAAFYVLAATALQLARQPGISSWDSIWQEDGGIFLNQALSEPFVHTLVHSYNSYLHVGPRLVAGVVALFPLDDAAKLLSGGECVAVSLMSIYVYYASAAIVRNQWARMAIAGAMILLPAAGYETNAVLSDMHWYLTFTAFWALLALPRSRGGIALAAIVVALAVLSDPFTGLFLPFTLFQGWRRRGERSAWIVPGVFVITLAIQLGFGLFSEPAGRYAPSHLSDIPGIFALRVTGSLFVGDQNLHTFWLQSWGWVFIYATLAATVAIVAYALRRPGWEWRLFVGQCFAYSVLYLAVPCMLRGTANFLDRSIYSLNGSRYMPLPILFLVALVVAVLDRRDPKVSAGNWRRIQWAAALWAAFLVLNNYSIVTTRSPGPSWKHNLGEARLKCMGKLPDERTAAVGGPVHPGPGDKVSIWVAPNVTPPLWGVEATCRQIQR